MVSTCRNIFPFDDRNSEGMYVQGSRERYDRIAEVEIILVPIDFTFRVTTKDVHSVENIVSRGNPAQKCSDRKLANRFQWIAKRMYIFGNEGREYFELIFWCDPRASAAVNVGNVSYPPDHVSAFFP